MTTDYCIEVESILENLVASVNARLREGYEPIGGPFVWQASDYRYICQALVRRAGTSIDYTKETPHG